MENMQYIKLNDHNMIPVIGLGTWQGAPGHEAEVYDAVMDAIDVGYRHFDCAHFYKNEKHIGEAIQQKIKEGVVKREDLFIVSKLWSTFHKPELVEPILKTTLSDLKLDYLDMYLIHWPMAYKEGDSLEPLDENGLYIPSDVDYVDTWKAMEKVQKKGLTKSIGVSNFTRGQLERILKEGSVVPVTNQVECHPFLNQKKLRAFCEKNGITITAFSPLGSPLRPWQKPGDLDVLNDIKIKEIATKHKKTPAQVLIRYSIQSGNIVIPKSANKKRLQDNLDVLNFQLSAEEMAFIDTFDCNGRICPNDMAKYHKDYPFKPEIEY